LSVARRFVSAARRAWGNNPMLVIKIGRSPAAKRQLHYHYRIDTAWDAAIPVSYTKMTLPTITTKCTSSWSPYH
ncbi:hypothetical protein, partial [Enterobacter asburiae]